MTSASLFTPAPNCKTSLPGVLLSQHGIARPNPGGTEVQSAHFHWEWGEGGTFRHIHTALGKSSGPQSFQHR